MTIYLRQATASQEIPLGYFVDSTDGNTEETGLTIANTDIKIWKTGATTLANKNSGGGTHISNGIYYAVLDATDTDTIGSLVIFVHVSGALTVKVECVVLDEAVYDVMFGTTALSTLTAAQVNTEADTALSDYGALKPTTAGRTLDVSAGGEAGVDWANVGSPTTTQNLSGTSTKAVEPVTAGRKLAISAANIADADVKRIWGTTGLITTVLASIVYTSVDTATESVVTVNFPMTNIQGNVSPDNASYEGWYLVITNLSTYWQSRPVEAFNGESIFSMRVPYTVAPSSGAAAFLLPPGFDVGSVRAAVGLASANLDTQLDALPTAAEIADAVWDEALSAHNTEDSVGNVLNDLTDEDGGGVYQFTINALENGPSGSGGGSTAADIWAYATRTLTQAAASVLAAVTGSSITVYRGTTWSITLTGLPTLTGYDTVYFSVKEKLSDPDTAAWVRVKNGASGLQRFMTDAPTSTSNGTLTTPSSTSVTITIQEEETVRAILKTGLCYDLKGVDNDGNVDLLSAGGTFTIAGDVTRAIT